MRLSCRLIEPYLNLLIKRNGSTSSIDNRDRCLYKYFNEMQTR